jgi:hypothetical protein
MSHYESLKFGINEAHQWCMVPFEKGLLNEQSCCCSGISLWSISSAGVSVRWRSSESEKEKTNPGGEGCIYREAARELGVASQEIGEVHWRVLKQPYGESPGSIHEGKMWITFDVRNKLNVFTVLTVCRVSNLHRLIAFWFHARCDPAMGKRMRWS